MVVPSRHPWGAFEVGSWKKVKVVTTTFGDKQRKLGERVTETKTTLVDVDRESYTLRVEAVVIVAGRRFESAPRFVRRGFDGEGDDDVVSYEDTTSETLTIGQQRIPSRIQKIVSQRGDTQRVSTVHFSGDVSPFVLRKRTVSIDSKTNSRLGETLLDVIEMAMPRRVLSQRRLVSEIKTVHTHPGGRSETTEYYTPEVPGGVVEHESSEFDKNGRLTQSSTLQLVGYGLGDGDVREDHRPRFFRLFRKRRR
ncbi:MAG: hypothetical protein RIC55_36090 [Pirellulaceae bacterium]